MYKHSRLSNNPNYVHDDMKPESAIEDGELSEKNQNNFEINTNTIKDDKDTNNLSNEKNINNEYNIDNENNINNENNISNNISNIKRNSDEYEEKIDDETPYQRKASGSNKDNIDNINNINNENDIYNIRREDNDENDNENNGNNNNNLIIDDDENGNSNNENINNDNKGMSEKDY